MILQRDGEGLIWLGGVLGAPRVRVVTSTPAAVLCQAPARWGRSGWDPVGSDHSHSLLLYPNPLGWKATEGWACIENYCWEKGLPKKWKSSYKKRRLCWDDVLGARKLHFKHLSPDTGYNHLHCASFAPCDTSRSADRNGRGFVMSRFPEIIQPLSAQRLCHLVRKAQAFFSQRKDAHVSPDEGT